MTYTTHNTTEFEFQNITIKVPITTVHRIKAQEFAKVQLSSEKSEQVYRNVLAVIATQNYLDMLDISSDLERSDSWDLASHFATDVADLYIPELEGRIECRAVQSGDETCFIPSDIWDERVGYLIVKLNEQCTEGTMLGFVPRVTTEYISLQDLQPLDDFIDCFPEVVADEVLDNSTPSRIADWLEGVFKEIWQPPDTLLAGGVVFARPDLVSSSRINQTQTAVNQLYASQRRSLPPLPEDASLETMLVHLIHHAQEEEARFQAAELLWQLDPTNPAGGVRRSLDLSLYIEGYTLGLLGAVLEKSDGRRSLLFQIYPTRDARFIPPGLQLIGLDENGDQFFEVIARERDNRISLKFLADGGDRFSIRVVLNDASLTENFIV